MNIQFMIFHYVLFAARCQLFLIYHLLYHIYCFLIAHASCLSFLLSVTFNNLWMFAVKRQRIWL